MEAFSLSPLLFPAARPRLAPLPLLQLRRVHLHPAAVQPEPQSSPWSLQYRRRTLLHRLPAQGVQAEQRADLGDPARRGGSGRSGDAENSGLVSTGELSFEVANEVADKGLFVLIRKCASGWLCGHDSSPAHERLSLPSRRTDSTSRRLTAAATCSSAVPMASALFSAIS